MNALAAQQEPSPPAHLQPDLPAANQADLRLAAVPYVPRDVVVYPELPVVVVPAVEDTAGAPGMAIVAVGDAAVTVGSDGVVRHEAALSGDGGQQPAGTASDPSQQRMQQPEYQQHMVLQHLLLMQQRHQEAIQLTMALQQQAAAAAAAAEAVQAACEPSSKPHPQHHDLQAGVVSAPVPDNTGQPQAAGSPAGAGGGDGSSVSKDIIAVAAAAAGHKAAADAAAAGGTHEQQEQAAAAARQRQTRLMQDQMGFGSPLPVAPPVHSTQPASNPTGSSLAGGLLAPNVMDTVLQQCNHAQGSDAWDNYFTLLSGFLNGRAGGPGAPLAGVAGQQPDAAQLAQHGVETSPPLSHMSAQHQGHADAHADTHALQQVSAEREAVNGGAQGGPDAAARSGPLAAAAGSDGLAAAAAAAAAAAQSMSALGSLMLPAGLALNPYLLYGAAAAGLHPAALQMMVSNRDSKIPPQTAHSRDFASKDTCTALCRLVLG